MSRLLYGLVEKAAARWNQLRLAAFTLTFTRLGKLPAAVTAFTLLQILDFFL